MGKRLIIQHGERITQHELTGNPVTIGRDPSCDLFFADQKLSRRHARIEAEADGVKLVDLGSRNGSWVNEQRVDEHMIEPDDKVRLGRLQITVEEDLPPTAASPVADDVTVMLSDTAQADDEGKTVRIDLTPDAVRDTDEVEPPDDTVLFKEAPSPDRDRTIVLSDTASSSEGEGTVIFQSPSEDAADTTSQTLQALPPTEPSIQREKGLDSHDLPPTAIGVSVEPVAETVSGQTVHPVNRKPLLVVVVLSFVAYLLVAAPLVLTTKSLLREESIARGRGLAELLTARNEAALAKGDFRDLSVDSVANEPGVEEALILDVEGRVLAPVGRSGQSHEAVKDASKKLWEGEDIHVSRIGAGDYEFIRPIALSGERLGFVVLRYSGARVAERKSVPVLLFLGFLLIAGGAWGAFSLANRQTMERVATETTLAENPNPTSMDF